MLVVTCLIKLQLPGVSSLKEKRRIIRSVLKRLTNEFNVAVAEVDHQDVWQSSEICLVSVGTDAAYLHGLSEKAVAWVSRTRPDIIIDQYAIEFR